MEISTEEVFTWLQLYKQRPSYDQANPVTLKTLTYQLIDPVYCIL